MTTSKKYFENLDALRFLAFFSVFLSHIFFTKSPIITKSPIFIKIDHFFELGFLGLDFFFVLSSFLITWTIFEEYNNTLKFSLKNFLVRRSLRIWPLYFIIVSLGFLAIYISNISTNQQTSSLPNFFYFLFFILNYYIIEHGQEFLFFLVFLWSIAVEEQFYFLWAFLLKFGKKYILFLFCSFIVASLIFRWYYLNSSSQLYFSTISALSNFSIGGLVAYLVFYKKNIVDVTNISKKLTVFVYLLLIMSLIFFDNIFNIPFFVVIQKLWFSIIFGFIIIEQSFSKNSFIKVGKIPFLNKLGKLSYGLYCFHGVVITILIKILEQLHFNETYWHVFLLYPIIIMAFTILIAHFSFKYVENYFLKLKTKFYTFTKK